ncbi:MAG: protein-glutamate O-methyltransferase CheR [Pirellulaceae bacterium]
MIDTETRGLARQELWPSLAEFHQLRDLIFTETGISLSDAKHSLVGSRLAKRVRVLRLDSYEDYLHYLRHEGGEVEMQEMINCITTNKTDFFRESHHFQFLRETVLPELVKKTKRGDKRKLRIWCAASSRGHEPYTIAMTLLDFFAHHSGWDIRVLASDIDTQVLETAAQGIYSLPEVEIVPDDYKQRFLLKGSGRNEGICKVRPEVRELITFRQINLNKRPWPIHTKFDVIFCRNVMIYFNRATQNQILNAMAPCLESHGYLMLGHSENICQQQTPFTPIGGTIYRLETSSK